MDYRLVKTFTVISFCVAMALAIEVQGVENRKHRIKRQWPFSSSQQNADRINEYYQTKPNDNWFVRTVQKPFARYVGTAFGDEFPKVRESIIYYQNQGKSFFVAHMPWNGYAPKNWVLNKNNDKDEKTSPYNGKNQFEGKERINNKQF